MKVKVRAEDFVVKEILDLVPQKDGKYVLAVIKKRNTNTLDVLRDISKRLGVSLDGISYCGMKDRYSLSFQYITLPNEKFKPIKAVNYEVEKVGYVDMPLSRDNLIANYFEITVRDVSLPDDIVERRISEVIKWGFVNYYDEQRFGSARHGKGFVVAEIIKRNYEKALKLYIAEYSRYDDKKVKRWKRLVKEKWGKWDESLIQNSGVYRKIVEFLAGRTPSKNTFKKALSLVDERVKSILISAYQSYIWNRVAVKIIEKFYSDSKEDLIVVPYLYGNLLFYTTLYKKEFLVDFEVPAISPKMKLDDIYADVVTEVLTEEGIGNLSSFKLPLTGWLFRSYRRRLVVFPQDMVYSIEKDELYPGKRKLKLKFKLPSGSFATVLLKRILKPS